MPGTSEARIKANQANALKSTGPRSAQGKDASRRNGLKHGLTGRGVVLAEPDAAEVDRRAAALLRELDPQSTLGKALVGQLATLSVRMERGARQEEEAVAGRARHSAEAFDHDRVERAEDLFDAIAADPRRTVRLLGRSPEGVDRLIEAWLGLRDVLTRAEAPHLWEPSHEATALHLAGLRPEQAKETRLERLSMAARGKGSLADPEWVALDYNAKRAWARDRLLERIDEQVAGLRRHRETLDFEAIALDRAGAADVAPFDSSREACLARRYEAEARRGFFRALREFRQAEAEAADRPALPEAIGPAPEPELDSSPDEVPMPSGSPLGSSCAGASVGPVQPRPDRRDRLEDLLAPRDGAPRGLDGRVLAVGRAAIMPG